MTKNKLVVGKQYNVTINNNTLQLYFLEVAEGYNNSCDCCGKNTVNGFIFCINFYGSYDQNNSLSYEKSWDSGVYFVGGIACLKKFVAEIV